MVPREYHEYVPHNKLTIDNLRALDFLAENVLQSDGISSEFRDAFPEFLHRHCFFVKIESEKRLILNVRLLWDVQSRRIFGVKLLRNFVLRIEEILQ